MEVKIKSKDIEVTPAISQYGEKRFANMDHFFKAGEDKEITLELSKTSEHHKQGNFFKVAVHGRVRNKSLHATSVKNDLYAAIDDARDEFVREIESGQGRYRALMLRGARKIKELMQKASPFGKKS